MCGELKCQDLASVLTTKILDQTMVLFHTLVQSTGLERFKVDYGYSQIDWQVEGSETTKFNPKPIDTWHEILWKALLDSEPSNIEVNLPLTEINRE